MGVIFESRASTPYGQAWTSVACVCLACCTLPEPATCVAAMPRMPPNVAGFILAQLTPSLSRQNSTKAVVRASVSITAGGDRAPCCCCAGGTDCADAGTAAALMAPRMCACAVVVLAQLTGGCWLTAWLNLYVAIAWTVASVPQPKKMTILDNFFQVQQANCFCC
jgi:hypothetical protein